MKKLLTVLLTSLILFSACTSSPSPGEANKVDPSTTPTPSTPAVKEQVIAKVGETLEVDGLQITFDRVERYVDKSTFIPDTPEPGKEFILLWFTSANTTGADIYMNPLYVEAYCDDFSITQKYMLLNVSGDTFGGDVAAGKKAKGYVAFEVDSGWETIELHYQLDYFGSSDSKMKFLASASDIQG